MPFGSREMKRYRVLAFDFDSRSHLLGIQVQEHWEEHVKAGWVKNQAEIRKQLVREFGELAADQKAQNLIDIDSKPFSVVAFHNSFLADCRDAFVIGAYYPALVGVCALGERVLNHLVLRLRDDYRSTPQYKRVYRKNSFDNWELAIATLEQWNVLTEDAANGFRELEETRNRSIHFSPDIDHNNRALALAAIKQFQNCILAQFSGIGRQEWFIPDTPGEAYIKRDWESHPFVRHVYLPNCALVGPRHSLDIVNHRFVVEDSEDYPDTPITDAEFIGLRRAGR